MKSFDPLLEVYSAGTKPARRVHPKAIQVMKEIGIDISTYKTKLVDRFLMESFDYVITVCSRAKETCPFFTGKVEHRLHISFDDPADATGSEDEMLAVFRRGRDEIKKDFLAFYQQSLSPEQRKEK